MLALQTVKSELCFHSVELLETWQSNIHQQHCALCGFYKPPSLASVPSDQFPIIWSSLMLCMQKFIGCFIKCLSQQIIYSKALPNHTLEQCRCILTHATVFSTVHWWHCMQYKQQTAQSVSVLPWHLIQRAETFVMHLFVALAFIKRPDNTINTFKSKKQNLFSVKTEICCI